MNIETTQFEIIDEGSFQVAIMSIKKIATDFGYNDIQVAHFLTATSELARNILKYAGNGLIEVRMIENGTQQGLEIIASDHGPGIEDLSQAMQESFSSGGSLGQGLPGAKRLMDDFSLASTVGKGTKVKATLWR
ncbi:MAG: anti-sigma regulatory factor [Bermanella sp.]